MGLKKMKKQNGFTLVELMIVIAIIGVLGALSFPSYDSYMKKSRRADAKVGLSKLADRQERFYLQKNTYADSFGAAGLNTSATSDEGYYTFSISSTNLVNGYVLTATAKTDKSQADDTGCTVMTLSSTGVKAPDGVGTDKDCW